ncbi:MAG: glycosyl hydrolase [Gammaproteobacteria bacterium]|nr:glycosyl hydrolase [Gammaproteobacteria bacterium]MDH4254044.1 glycosyl hydrolase [Gammaproteobacteria bacterium]MDH5309519.1 glycosyl hydrolase [Gammaproteobacteria bacterium]
MFRLFSSDIYWLSRVGRFLLIGCAVLLPVQAAIAAAPDGLSEEDLAALKWRELGTAATSGRITRFAVHPEDASVIYAATASGGLWKTVNAGTTWQPIFEHQSTVSMGDVALVPGHPDIVWIGTGEQNSVRSSQFGDGVYRSDDAGKTWRHMGLAGSRHVGRILIHPENPDIVYVAALGSLWGSNPERGLYRTTDGGKTWIQLLRPSEYTGVVEVQMHPGNPDILFAATFQRERRMWSMVGGGSEGGLYRSTDGGDTWARVGNGFPTGPVGRVGVTFCPSRPDTLYATAVGPEGGTFRSTDGGASWERRNAEVQSHWYYGELVCDPENPDHLYIPVTPLLKSEDGGMTFSNIAESMVHGDHHTLWVNPEDSDHLMTGNDGGVYVSQDRGKTWRWVSNLPLMQLYTVAVDMQEPFYHVYGGTQDNGSWGGPIGTRYSDGIANEDWMFLSGGDGFFAVADPTDPAIIYSQTQYGVLFRTDRKSGEQRRIQPWQPQDGEFPPYRWNWSAPFAISPHDPRTLYFGANVVFRSRDRGTSWERISPDLTRQISRDELPLQGRIPAPDMIDLHASTAMYGNAHSLSVSTIRKGQIAVGTDDGLIQVSRDDGKNWQRSDSFPGVPDMMKVGMVSWSPTAEGTLFAVFDGHKDNDFRPHVVRSNDYGRTWRNITSDLPTFGPTRSITVHPRNGELVFTGTDFGVYFSRDGGGHWLPLRSGLPTNSVQGIVVHPRENDLVIGTHGRGFWILDEISLLEKLTPDAVAGHSLLAPPRRATQIRDVRRGRGQAGHSYWTASNPPRGAILDYWIGDGAVGNSIVVAVLDEQGRLVRQVAEGKAARGAHRVVWDLRHEAPPSDSESPSRKPLGRFVLPGAYQVRLSVGDEVHTQTLTVRPDPAVDVSQREQRDRETTLALQARLVAAAYHSGQAVDAAVNQTEEFLEALVGTQPNAALQAQAQEAADSARRLHLALRGIDPGLAQQETYLPLAELTLRLYMTTESWSGAPSPEQSRLTQLAHRDMSRLLAQIRPFLAESLPALRASADANGLAWPGDALPTALPEDLIPNYR